MYETPFLFRVNMPKLFCTFYGTSKFLTTLHFCEALLTVASKQIYDKY